MYEMSLTPSDNSFYMTMELNAWHFHRSMSDFRQYRVSNQCCPYCKINHEIVKMTNTKEFLVLSIIFILFQNKRKLQMLWQMASIYLSHHLQCTNINYFQHCVKSFSHYFSTFKIVKPNTKNAHYENSKINATKVLRSKI